MQRALFFFLLRKKRVLITVVYYRYEVVLKGLQIANYLVIYKSIKEVFVGKKYFI